MHQRKVRVGKEGRQLRRLEEVESDLKSLDVMERKIKIWDRENEEEWLSSVTVQDGNLNLLRFP